MATIDITADGPQSKRRKVESSLQTTRSSRKSQVFAPFRTVGLVSSTKVPFTSIPLGKTTFQITTSVGHTLQTYDLKRGLNLVFLSRPRTPEIITASLAVKQCIYAAWGRPDGEGSKGVWVFQRGMKIDEFEAPRDAMECITKLLQFGSWIVGCGTSKLEIWKSGTFEHHTTLDNASRNGQIYTGTICNMPTYVNKILAGRQDGCVEVWNVNSGRLIHTILPISPELGAVTSVEPSPVLSLIAIAYSTGPIVLHNVRTDRPLLVLNNSPASAQPITSITFRSDGLGAGADGQTSGIMATASSDNGDITFWDLNDGGRRTATLRGAHAVTTQGGINRIEFLSGQAILTSSGMDNSLQTWIFDDVSFSSLPRILHRRSGHAGAVSSIKFLPTEAMDADSVGKWLLSGSRDCSLWGWSLWRDGQSTELSQGAIQSKARKKGLIDTATPSTSTMAQSLKAPPITAIACSLNRDGGMGALPGRQGMWAVPGHQKKMKYQDAETAALTGWESVVTAHEGSNLARTWFWGRKRAGRWMFKSGDGSEVSALAMSACGTFAILGSNGGSIVMHNLQSGILRQQFPAPPRSSYSKKSSNAMVVSKAAKQSGRDEVEVERYRRTKHKSRVTGVGIDALNQTVFSCSADGFLKFWDLKGTLLTELTFQSGAMTGLRHHTNSDLIAISSKDGYIRIVDISSRKLVRELVALSGSLHRAADILDFCFSPDGRWMLASSTDRVLRIWDISTGHLIEALRFASAPRVVAFSPTGEFFATGHEDSFGISIWTNRTLFAHVSMHEIHPQDVVDIFAPDASGEGGENLLEAAFADDSTEAEDDQYKAQIPEQLSKQLLTLSLVPKPRWQSLLHLDTIKQRNKPIEPPSKPKSAPFFLPSMNTQTKSGIDQEEFASPSQSLVLLPKSETTSDRGSKSRITKIVDPHVTRASTFTTLVRNRSLNALISHLATLPPASADLAIRGLETFSPYTELTTFLNALTRRLRDKRDFELVQTWIAVFLRCHRDVLLESEQVRDALAEWKVENDKTEKGFSQKVGFCRGVSGWISGVV